MASDRGDVEEEIRSLRRLFSDYMETDLEEQSYRRTENIQILVSLGILGGIISLYVQGKVQNSVLEYFYWIIGGSSVFYLLMKTLIPPIRTEVESDLLAIFDDRIIPFVYVFFVLLSVSVGTFSLRDQLPALPHMGDPNFWLGVSTLILSLFIAYIYSRRHQVASEARYEKRKRILDEIENLTERDIIRYLFQNPQKISKDIDEGTLEHHPPFGRVLVEMFAESVDGTPILIKVNGYETNIDDVEQLEENITRFKEDNNLQNWPRGILVAPVFTREAQKRISEDESLELVEIPINELEN